LVNPLKDRLGRRCLPRNAAASGSGRRGSDQNRVEAETWHPGWNLRTL